MDFEMVCQPLVLDIQSQTWSRGPYSPGTACTHSFCINIPWEVLE